MTEEELIKDIAECFANCEGSVPIKLRHYEWANVVLNLIKEAGWKSPSDIQTPEFSRCRRQSAGMTC